MSQIATEMVLLRLQYASGKECSYIDERIGIVHSM